MVSLRAWLAPISRSFRSAYFKSFRWASPYCSNESSIPPPPTLLLPPGIFIHKVVWHALSHQHHSDYRGNCFPLAYVKPLCLVCIGVKDWDDVHYYPSKIIWWRYIHQQTPVLNTMKPCEQCGSLRLTKTISKSLLLLLSRFLMNSALKKTVFQFFLVCHFPMFSFVVVFLLKKRWFPAGCDMLVSLLFPQTSLQWNKSWIKAV